ncbi:MAG: hypothetical protein QHC78_11420 [Pigmentiphaga sp.]|uniref:hypothetical protein n=1 Tax=Pigmentiphaga sp. TaxID=1977564 RepID=UPI0029A61543|nr:hypothetical protein [Pigmentiphaga sp.]MDX3906289.1 hypothetical protein [Pigmentiphaga sp.]
MRGTIDCAVLMVPEHRQWMHEFIEDWASSCHRVALHRVYLDDAGENASEGACVPAPTDALARLGLVLKRYDACLLPVTLATLGWTRTALALADGTRQTPLLGLVRGMSAAGLQDLLSFGLDDFMRYPLCAEEFKTRLALMAGPAKPPRPADAEGEPAQPGDMPPQPAESDEALREPFQTAKAKVVTQFERHYIADMLMRHQGNISQAARAACKNRRAFWQLMRKHDIAAAPYRQGLGAREAATSGAGMHD